MVSWWSATSHGTQEVGGDDDEVVEKVSALPVRRWTVPIKSSGLTWIMSGDLRYTITGEERPWFGAAVFLIFDEFLLTIRGAGLGHCNFPAIEEFILCDSNDSTLIRSKVIWWEAGFWSIMRLWIRLWTAEVLIEAERVTIQLEKIKHIWIWSALNCSFCILIFVGLSKFNRRQ